MGADKFLFDDQWRKIRGVPGILNGRAVCERCRRDDLKTAKEKSMGVDIIRFNSGGEVDSGRRDNFCRRNVWGFEEETNVSKISGN